MDETTLLIYASGRNKSGPNRDPWGTPHVIGSNEDLREPYSDILQTRIEIATHPVERYTTYSIEL